MSQTTLNDVETIIKRYLATIEPGQRIKYSLPSDLIIEKWDDHNEINWDIGEEIQMLVRGPIPNDIFVTLRFESNETEIIVDFYRLS